MRFITDENLGVKVPRYLQKRGFDVISIKDFGPGVSDQEVLGRAKQENRILVTLDKDFGELVFKKKLVHKGVILLRLRDESVENKRKVLLRELQSGRDFEGKFTVIRDQIRPKGRNVT